MLLLAASQQVVNLKYVCLFILGVQPAAMYMFPERNMKIVKQTFLSINLFIANCLIAESKCLHITLIAVKRLRCVRYADQLILLPRRYHFLTVHSWQCCQNECWPYMDSSFSFPQQTKWKKQTKYWQISLSTASGGWRNPPTWTLYSDSGTCTHQQLIATATDQENFSNMPLWQKLINQILGGGAACAQCRIQPRIWGQPGHSQAASGKFSVKEVEKIFLPFAL